MSKNFPMLRLILWILCALSGCNVPQYEIAPGNKSVEILHEEHIRSVKFYIPKKLKRRKRSLVLCLHRENESAESFARLSKRGFEIEADREGFIVAYPEGLNEWWNDGREDSLSLSHYNDIDDVGFMEKLIDYSVDSFRVDPEQIFVAGMSNGGFMTFRLACELSKKIKGIAVVSAGLALDQLVDCNADSTVSVMLISGTGNPVLPFDGGEMILDERSQGSILSAQATVSYWLEENKCKEKFTKRDVSNTNLFDETRSEKFIYSNCAKDTKVELIVVTNGGHTWPGGRQYASEKSVGKTAKDFDAAKEIWRFFKGL